MTTFKCFHCGDTWSAGPTRDMNLDLKCRVHIEMHNQIIALQAEVARLREALEQIIRKSTEVNEWALANIARAALEVKP